jgi:histidinol phosphatase-like enzyme
MKSKLLALDKDGTITITVSGETFVRSPDDQKLIPGIAEKISEYIAEGWKIVIVSNQGGCEVRTCNILDLPIGSYYLHGDTPLKVEEVSKRPDKVIVHTTLRRAEVIGFPETEVVKFQYKTIADAIEEVRFAMKLAGIEIGYFCPDMDGQKCYVVGETHNTEIGSVSAVTRGLYRKPNPGMLQEALFDYSGEYLTPKQIPDRGIECLMIGDRQEDMDAAIAAGFQFKYITEFLS